MSDENSEKKQPGPEKQLPEPGEKLEDEVRKDEPENPRPEEAASKDGEESMPEPGPAPEPVEQANPGGGMNPATGEDSPPRTREQAGDLPKPTTPTSIPPEVTETQPGPEPVAKPAPPPGEPPKIEEESPTGDVVKPTPENGKDPQPLSQAARDLAEAARSRLQGIRAGGEEAIGDRKEQLQEKQRRLRLELEQKAERFNQATVDALDSAWVKAGEYRRRGEETLKNDTGKVIGIAAAAGFLVGLLFIRRRR